jgi:hypothetical protein
MKAIEIESAPSGRIVLGFELTASGKESGVETRARFWTVSQLEDGKIRTRKSFRDRAEALEAAGLSD